MAAINGTTLLLYSEGVAVAMQKGLSISVDQDLPDATNKESVGWARHINGILTAGIDFDALFSTGLLTDTPAIMGAKDLMDYIINRESMLIEILGLAYPIVGEADLSKLSFAAPQENTMTLAGNLKVKGELYVLASLPTGKYVNLVTDPDSGGTDYETHTDVAKAFTALINVGGTAYAKSNTFAVTSGYVYKFITFLTVVSGQVPSVAIFEVGGGAAAISNVVALTAGLNIITLTATDTHDGCLNISNTGASSLKTSPIYLFRV
jgi:predicted secreted protein